MDAKILDNYGNGDKNATSAVTKITAGTTKENKDNEKKDQR